MRLLERQQALDSVLAESRNFWHPQPFRDVRPDWCETHPALLEALNALSDEEVVRLNDDGLAALDLIARYQPDLADLAALAALPERFRVPLLAHGPHWCRDIPGRKREQIEAFATSARQASAPVIDWCGGKGHLGRLLALQWQTPVSTLEIDATLCAEGAQLAARRNLPQEFVVADALTATEWPCGGQHAVALHACGNLHRRLISRGVAQGVVQFDVAPCCYHRGVDIVYQPLSAGLSTVLTRDDTRLAVTETVTASPRLARQRDKEMAWKLGFDAYRREASGLQAYKTFKPVPAAWFREGFETFLALMAGREGLPVIGARSAADFERQGWQRQREVMRLSIVRHAFRRPMEIWLALDLAAFLEAHAYRVELGVFCARHLTPRNLLISARRV